MAVFDDFGRPLVAGFIVEPTPGHAEPHHYDVVLASAGGGKGVPRNRDYTQALEILLRRLGGLHGRLLDAAVDSRNTALRKLPLAERRVLLPAWHAVDLYTVKDFKELRLSLTGSQKNIGAKPRSKGGNERRRLRLTVNVPAAGDAGRLEQLLTRPETVEIPDTDEAGIDEVGTGAGAGAAGEPDRAPYRSGMPDARNRKSGRGQGRSADSAANRAVEMRAMALAEAHYRAEGWAVSVVANTSSWDLTCRKDGVEKHVEVKGLTGTPEGVHLTANEVRHALTYSNPALFVVHGIVVHRCGDEVTADGGTELLWDPWVIALDRATATQYHYALDGPT
ncbi:protein NO VEIN domain-containing protein [Embleya sp. NPDC020886]|uniref:protein NO VEIN domain-containing protein n=1 Tax=Embleya sp. NPDC020886 TaxID=3363980 RepID=UPI0037A294E7